MPSFRPRCLAGLTSLALTLATISPGLRAEAVQHLVLFQFKQGTGSEQLHAVADGFDALARATPGLIGFQGGRNNSPEGLSKGYTHGYVIPFDGIPSRDAYMTSGPHEDFRKLVLPLLADVFALDFTLPGPPEPAEPGRVHHMARR